MHHFIRIPLDRANRVGAHRRRLTSSKSAQASPPPSAASGDGTRAGVCTGVLWRSARAAPKGAAPAEAGRASGSSSDAAERADAALAGTFRCGGCGPSRIARAAAVTAACERIPREGGRGRQSRVRPRGTQLVKTAGQNRWSNSTRCARGVGRRLGPQQLHQVPHGHAAPRESCARRRSRRERRRRARGVHGADPSHNVLGREAAPARRRAGPQGARGCSLRRAARRFFAEPSALLCSLFGIQRALRVEGTKPEPHLDSSSSSASCSRASAPSLALKRSLPARRTIQGTFKDSSRKLGRSGLRPVSTGGGTRRVQLVRGEGRDVST
jgi:hypothetical protein